MTQRRSFRALVRRSLEDDSSSISVGSVRLASVGADDVPTLYCEADYVRGATKRYGRLYLLTLPSGCLLIFQISSQREHWPAALARWLEVVESLKIVTVMQTADCTGARGGRRPAGATSVAGPGRGMNSYPQGAM